MYYIWIQTRKHLLQKSSEQPRRQNGKSLDISQSLSSVTQSKQNRHTNRVDMVTETEVMCKPKSMNPTYQGQSSYCCLWISNLSATEINTEAPIWRHCSRKPTSHLAASWLHGASPSCKGQPFILAGIGTNTRVWASIMLRGLCSASTTGLDTRVSHPTRRPISPWRRCGNEPKAMGSTHHHIIQ